METSAPTTTFAERVQSFINGPRATHAHVSEGVLSLTLATGATVTIPVSALKTLAPLSGERIEHVLVRSGGTVLLWAPDVSIAVEGLLEFATGLQTLKTAQRKGGSARSEAKAASSRANGAKGGRPRKQTQEIV